ncbi:MAG: Ig-like domain-containing protein, partial [Oscillospiraceae bacterium]|nr:Ig-like domain-containing protein [Oscillospiraceae bacterium]
MRQDKMKTRGKRILGLMLAALLALGAAPAAEAAVRQNSGAKAPAASHSDDTVTRYDPRQSAPVKTFAAHVDEGNWRFFAEGTPIVVRENGWITSVYDTGGNLLSGATDLFYYDIYGGWESGDHNGDTSVTVESGTLWSVYGGSLAGTITGSTVVRIEGGEADSVFGGSGGEAAPLGPDDPPAAPAAIAGNTSVFISGGNISGTVYGGGNNAPVSGRASVAVTNSNLYGTVVFGGGFGANVTGDTGVLVENSEIRIVIGGGYDSDVAGDTYVTVKNSEIERVYGGGENYANVEGTANVSVVNSAVDTVYGGGNNYGSVGAARLTIGEDASESGTYGFAAAGGISSMVEEDTRLEIYGGTFGRCVIAGGDDYSNETEGLVGGNTELMIHGGTFHDAVYGGGWFAAVEGDTGITVEDGMFHGAVLGGGRRGTVEGGTEMTIRGGVFEQPICAGGDADIAVTGSTALTVDGGTFLWVFGGGWQADVNGGTGVTVNGGTFTTLSGGGCGLGGINGNTSVTVNGGSFGWIYGGGLGDFDTGTGGAVTGNTSVIINNCGNADYVIGGGGEYGAIVGGTANIKLKGGTVTAVYGGGWSGDVIGAAVVDVWPEATINRVAAGAADENLATVGAGSKVNYWQYLTYDANGGGGGVARGEAIVGTAAAAAASAGMTPPDGKVFKEWNTGADGSGDTYAPGASVIVPENGLTLYAVWEDTPDTLVSGITVSGAGGTAAISVKGASLQMEALVSPADATDSSVTWSVIDGPGSATISASGLLKAVTDGTVTVRATANDGSGIYGECEIAISGQRVSVTSVTVGGGAEISETGGTLNLTANVLPADADEAGVRWSVANKDASLRTARAAIDQSGVLTALRNGVV